MCFIKDGTWEKLSFETEESASDVRPEFCDLLPEQGPCHGEWSRYYFDVEANECMPFIYGGCDGNENNFHLKKACETICQKPSASEDQTLFDIIFGSLKPDPVPSLEENDHKSCNVSISFDNGFEDWNHKNFEILPYKSTQATLENVTKGLNRSSTHGLTPQYTINSALR